MTLTAAPLFWCKAAVIHSSGTSIQQTVKNSRSNVQLKSFVFIDEPFSNAAIVSKSG